MTEAPDKTSEASHINDLSRKGTVPLPKVNSSNLKDSASSDSRPLSMPEASENNSQSQTEYNKKLHAIQKSAQQLCKNAKPKANVAPATSKEPLEGNLGKSFEYKRSKKKRQNLFNRRQIRNKKYRKV